MSEKYEVTFTRTTKHKEVVEADSQLEAIRKATAGRPDLRGTQVGEAVISNVEIGQDFI